MTKKGSKTGTQKVAKKCQKSGQKPGFWGPDTPGSRFLVGLGPQKRAFLDPFLDPFLNHIKSHPTQKCPRLPFTTTGSRYIPLL